MKIGVTDELRGIGLRQWRRLAADLRIDPVSFCSRIMGMADGLPDHVASSLEATRAEGLRHPVLEELSEKLADRARACRRSMLLAELSPAT